MPPHDRRGPLFGLLASIHPRHHVWGKIIWLFDRPWRIIRWVWGTIVVGGLAVGAVVALLTNGTTGLADPRTWIVIRPLLAHPHRAIAARYRGHRAGAAPHVARVPGASRVAAVRGGR